MRHFRVDVGVRVPRALTIVEPAASPGDMPKKLGTRSLIPSVLAFLVDALPVCIAPAAGATSTAPSVLDQADINILSVLTTATDFEEAIKLAQPAAEHTLDYLSFSLQSHLVAISLTVVDVTPPLAVGQLRRACAYTEVDALIRPKFRRTVSPPLQRGELALDHTDGLAPPTSSRLKLALWWYVKSLATPFLIDRLIFLFTCVEQLAKPHANGPYRTNCNHTISHCPDCGSSLSRPLPGESVKRYMVEVAGLSTDEAQTLWSTRQAVHGRDVFESSKWTAIGPLTSRLSAALSQAIASELGFPKGLAGLRSEPTPTLEVFGAKLALEIQSSEQDLHLAKMLSSLSIEQRGLTLRSSGRAPA